MHTLINVAKFGTEQVKHIVIVLKSRTYYNEFIGTCRLDKLYKSITELNERAFALHGNEAYYVKAVNLLFTCFES